MSLDRVHHELYKRVRLKAIVFLLTGLSLVFGRIPSNSSPEYTLRVLLFNLPFWAVAFITIAIGIMIGTRIAWRNYLVSKIFLGISMAFAIMWILAFVLTVLTEPKAPSTFFLFVIVFWSYFTYHLWHVVSDKQWIMVDLLNV